MRMGVYLPFPITNSHFRLSIWCATNSFCTGLSKVPILPFPVEYMVCHEQSEHSHSQPLMCCLAHKTVGHQKQQRDSHCGIDCELDFLN